MYTVCHTRLLEDLCQSSAVDLMYCSVAGNWLDLPLLYKAAGRQDLLSALKQSLPSCTLEPLIEARQSSFTGPLDKHVFINSH